MNTAQINAFQASLALPKTAPCTSMLSKEDRLRFGGNDTRHFLAMRRGIRFLLDHAVISARSGLTTANALEFAHQVTRPELLQKPWTGVDEMNRLSDVHRGDELERLYTFASDAFAIGAAGPEDHPLQQFVMDTPASHIRNVMAMLELLSAPPGTMNRVITDCQTHLTGALEKLAELPPLLCTCGDCPDCDNQASAARSRGEESVITDLGDGVLAKRPSGLADEEPACDPSASALYSSERMAAAGRID